MSILLTRGDIEKFIAQISELKNDIHWETPIILDPKAIFSVTSASNKLMISTFFGESNHVINSLPLTLEIILELICGLTNYMQSGV